MEFHTARVSKPGRFSEFIGTRQTPVIIRDAQLMKRDRKARAQLRSVPFLLDFEFHRFLYDSLWHEPFSLVDHEFRSPRGTTPSDATFPLAHLVTSDQLKPRHQQEYEHEDISQAGLTWDLFKRATEHDQLYVLVSDTDSPQVPTRTPSIGRSIADQFNAVTFEYGRLIHDYVANHVDSELPLHDTRNLYFHRISECHARHGAPASTLPGLFDYEAAPAESPVWDPLHYFIENELEEILDDYTAHITSSLRSWVEYGDTEKIAKRMIATLHRCGFDTDRLAEYQHDSDR